jgi:predicted O-linked N-acetylglucosamine transferase (SPINDLY family)
MHAPEHHNRTSLDNQQSKPARTPLKKGKPSAAEMNTLLTMLNQHRLIDANKLAVDLTQCYPADGFGWKVLGATCLQQGLMSEALAALEVAITLLPKDSEVHYNLGNYHYDQLQFIEAASHYQQAIKFNSSFAEAHYNLGSVQKELGLHDEAEFSYKTALKLKPKSAEINFNLAQVIYEQARYLDAIHYYQQAIKQQPDFVAAHVNLGACYKALGRLDDAISSYKNALKFNPEHADAYNNLGVVLKELGDIAQAESCYQAAIAINADYVPAYNNLSILLKDTGRKIEAESFYLKALKIDPLRAVTHSNLAVLLRELGRFADSEMCCRNALKIVPDYVDAHNNLGLALDSQGKFDEAMVAFEQALIFDPNNISALSNYSVTLNTLGQLSRAEICLKKALVIAPQFINAHINLCVNYLAQGRVHEAEEICIKTLQIQPDNLDAQSNLLFSMNYSSAHSPAACLDKASEYAVAVSKRIDAPFTSWVHDVNSKRLRVGLVSGDLRQHVVAYFLESFLQHVDSSSLELIAYSTTHQEDSVSARLKPHFSGWKSLVGLSDQVAAQLIHDDGVHVLLDLSGHSAGNRLPIFAWKPSPVQVSWLGYFATTGLTAMDYFIADEMGVPASEQCQFSEKIKYLPDTRLCFTAPDVDVVVSTLPALSNQFVTFGSFQNMAKVSDDVLDLWAEVLIAMPSARLRWQYKSFNDHAVAHDLKMRLTKRGIDAGRVDLLGAVTREEYLAAHHEVDVILDTFPFNGGTTTCEALWMGVPTLTLAGNTLISRQGASLLSAACLADWVAENKADFVNKALVFCRDLNQLAKLRAALRAQVLASALFDAKRFADHMQTALWEMCNDHNVIQSKDIKSKANHQSLSNNPALTALDNEQLSSHLKNHIEIVSATRFSESDFWSKSALGLSLKRHLKQDARLSAYIAFENTRGLSEIFNNRIDQAGTDTTLVFIHDDVWIDEADFANTIASGLERFDVIGVAGNKRILPNQPAWAFVYAQFTWDDSANLSGQIAHNQHAFGTAEVYGEAPAACELLDGVFLAVKKSSLTNANVRFDEQFDFHFYDLDFCRTAKQSGLSLGTWLINLTHQSTGAFGSQRWQEKYQDYLNKWEDNKLQINQPNTPLAINANVTDSAATPQISQELQSAMNEVLNIALTHEEAGQYEQAEHLYSEILEVQPNHAEANHHLGILQSQSKGALFALPRFEFAVQAKPENEQFWVSYIDAIMQTSAIDVAVNALELGQKYGLRSETAQMLAAEFMKAYESNQHLSKQAPLKVLNLQIQHELKETF